MANSGSLLTAVVAASVSIVLVGCRSKHNEVVHEVSRSSRTMEAGTGILIDPATTGAIEGTVHFAGKPPEPLKIDVRQDPACTASDEENVSEQYVVHEGKLANVYVYVKSGPPTVMLYVGQTLPPVVLEQKGCRFVPHVIAVLVGGTVEFRNSDGTMHDIHTMPMGGGSKVDVSQQVKGAPQQRRFNKAAVMMPLRCNRHPWMEAFLNVAATPFFAVTDDEGHFEIKGLAPGTYTLAAVHEKMGEQTITVQVASKESAKAEFTYSLK